MSGAIRLSGLLGNNIKAIGQEILVGFLPGMKDTIQALIDFVQEANRGGQLVDFLKRAMRDLGAAISFVIDNFRSLASAITALLIYRKVSALISLDTKRMTN